MDGTTRSTRDDLGVAVALPRPPRRVVSLVPSLTETLAASVPQALVGATDWCTHPAGLPVGRVGGTKWPDLAAVRALRPDLVVANEEENRRADVEALRAERIAVWVTAPRTVPESFASLRRLLMVCGVDPDAVAWLARAEQVWPAQPPPVWARAVVPIWRRPWMVLGRDTFAGDLLRRLGVANTYADAAERYPTVRLDDLRATPAELVVLPDEPYAFSATDGPECFPGRRHALVSGRHLTWYGPSLADAYDLLSRQLHG